MFRKLSQLFHVLLSILDIDAAFWLLTQLATLQVVDAMQNMFLCGIHILYASSITFTYHINSCLLYTSDAADE